MFVCSNIYDKYCILGLLYRCIFYNISWIYNFELLKIIENDWIIFTLIEYRLTSSCM